MFCFGLQVIVNISDIINVLLRLYLSCDNIVAFSVAKLYVTCYFFMLVFSCIAVCFYIACIAVFLYCTSIISR